ncbi:restriction endonuclease subunit S [Caldiplasma sukawensis]
MEGNRSHMKYITGMIPDDWKLDKLGNLFYIKTGKTNVQDSTKYGEYPLFDRSSAIKRSSKYLFDSEAIIVPGEGKEFLPRYFNGKFDLHQRAYALIPKDKSINVRFVFYWIYLNRVYFEKIAVGSTVKSLRLEHFYNFHIHLPSKKEQDSISLILSYFDTKIELNEKMNKTLEAIAKAIFKHWFVDFEFPNEEGKPYKSSGGEMVDSELGEIPKGWEVKKTGDVITVTRGVSYRTDQLTPSNNVLVTLKSVVRGGGFTKKGFKSYSGDYKSDQVLHSKDIIMAFTDLTQLAEVIGRPALVEATNVYDTMIASMDIGIIRPKEDFQYRYFIYQLLKSAAFQSHILGYVNGTTVLHLNNEGPKSFKFPCPDIKRLDMFESVVSQLYERTQKNSNQVESLTSIRDLILPKLMSGKLRVPLEE